MGVKARSVGGGQGDSMGTGVTPDGDPVLAARLTVPTVPGTFVRRDRLVEQLTDGARSPLTLVNGPAGAGKTLLVADWITACEPGSVAWLTVESQDSAPGVFWSYVLHAFRRHGVALPESIGSPALPGEVDHSLLARLAAWLNEQDSRVVLVLDEFDRVAGSAAVADELQFVLRHAGDGLRLVIISRTEPLLPLYRYRAAGELVDIRADDLAFRAEETATLIDRHGLPLPAEAARTLTERTEGWAAGLRLCVLAAQRADDPEGFLKDFEAGHSTVADFLLGEVLRAHPAETQDLLLRTSILEKTHPDLANALTGRDDAEPVLEELQRTNAFVEPLGHSWYRLHSLFAEILRVHLRVRHPGLEPELHRTAAEWLSRAGLLDEALRHAADAGDWELASVELVDHLAIGRLLTGLSAERLDDLFARMTPEASGPAPRPGARGARAGPPRRRPGGHVSASCGGEPAGGRHRRRVGGAADLCGASGAGRPGGGLGGPGRDGGAGRRGGGTRPPRRPVGAESGADGPHAHRPRIGPAVGGPLRCRARDAVRRRGGRPGALDDAGPA